MKLLLRREWWETYGDLVDPMTLPTKEYRRVFDLIAQYHTRDLGMPQQPDLDVPLLWYFLRQKDGVDADHGSYAVYTEVLGMVAEDSTPLGVARDLVTDYVRGAGLSQLAQLSARWDETTSSGSFKEQLWQRAKEVAVGLDGLDGTEVAVKPVSIRESPDMEGAKYERIPMGVSPRIDAAVGGGFPAGKLVCVVAPPGVGKTRLLVNVGAEAVRRGRTVIHATLEIDAIELTRWYYTILTGIPYADLRDSAEARDRAQRIWDQHPQWGDIVVADYAASSCGIGTIKRLIKTEVPRLRDEGKDPAMFLLDYMALMDGLGEDRYSSLGTAAREIRKLLHQYKLLGWTAAQANRQAMTEGVTRIHHIADSMEIPRVMDAILLISQNPQERHLQEFRMSFDKNRFGGSNPTVVMEYENDTLAVWQREARSV